ncbi:hypothetical protein OGAPHI_002048 [Ogataea philodendri]|uniref:CUE domain-containing protein n=1 Tax=Ogataea philodendri TaxID=1378263 RepID=A0A9P8PBM7_9ASCO|nr:uncharacterized protein OGAPHI_002048 [Ogataea philodendri]KAH3668294.1 hypothetical protein OGAPHI_002048 [Ogataea philodendri]
MDNTVTLVVTLVVAFVFIAYFLGEKSPVTDEMVARVAQVAPSLSPDVIRRDLERTRNVHQTIDNYLNNQLGPTGISEPHSAETTQSIQKPKAQAAHFEGLDFEQKKREMVLRARQRLNLN